VGTEAPVLTRWERIRSMWPLRLLWRVLRRVRRLFSLVSFRLNRRRPRCQHTFVRFGATYGPCELHRGHRHPYHIGPATAEVVRGEING
jgi:hypothetical protein